MSGNELTLNDFYKSHQEKKRRQQQDNRLNKSLGKKVKM